jgi:hypothetical protein
MAADPSTVPVLPLHRSLNYAPTDREAVAMAFSARAPSAARRRIVGTGAGAGARMTTKMDPPSAPMNPIAVGCAGVHTVYPSTPRASDIRRN